MLSYSQAGVIQAPLITHPPALESLSKIYMNKTI